MPQTSLNARDELVERLRERLAQEPVTREIAMFGGRAFMVDEKMAVCALKSGDLLVRVDADEHEELLATPGAETAEMGVGRTMGPGWIAVTAESIDDDEVLTFWCEKAIEYNRKVTGR
ncbi:MAG TPA: TfoX/Sxy family protein [Gordonia sp. (in: high G+C Gram-positive bacteria)]|uniref:TfoX/Sxy family protein n=1 Tax=unclassified Gordonia (in: high G+C Gram-positive bacteria) TaxID=2657482 RepID=UPI0025C6338B|nr:MULTISPECIES: TfoX/Sxy family protein [unclassified Gordonia (in: high G+C Gram-positive bacteria)]HNP57298.1 TfoX/Sxy family protein [Gordonia sp. (in: high G+C Gram-positive bacteria)]HRC52260.1 TfoX/Sxy family protein [Gordonia sp. (in: high G+C Gram-positive bacteria)]